MSLIQNCDSTDVSDCLDCDRDDLGFQVLSAEKILKAGSEDEEELGGNEDNSPLRRHLTFLITE